MDNGVYTKSGCLHPQFVNIDPHHAYVFQSYLARLDQSWCASKADISYVTIIDAIVECITRIVRLKERDIGSTHIGTRAYNGLLIALTGILARLAYSGAVIRGWLEIGTGIAMQ